MVSVWTQAEADRTLASPGRTWCLGGSLAGLPWWSRQPRVEQRQTQTGGEWDGSDGTLVQGYCVSAVAGIHAPTVWGWPYEHHPTDLDHTAETGTGCWDRIEPSIPNKDQSGKAIGGWDVHLLVWPAHPCREGNLPGWYVFWRLHTWKSMTECNIIIRTRFKQWHVF